ncbi:hypothetical protein J4E90_001290 [Alternaria incomplexa]|uniref:uncharacterized protein n=1 Tax=Alternaria incomplexa TaxID=1187928 RepID=UPI00221FEDE5|nr:uncharacterized protein J4E90_001290 [Alternaria incomplexa]KAI4922855.1 hypothetical protein J4E90_001290 [Alternaria incomplexa]
MAPNHTKTDQPVYLRIFGFDLHCDALTSNDHNTSQVDRVATYNAYRTQYAVQPYHSVPALASQSRKSRSVLTVQEPNIYTALSHAAMSLPPLSNTETLLPNFPAERPLLPARNASDGETDYSTDDNLSSTGSDGWVDFGRGDLYEDICDDDDDDNNNNKNNDDNKNHTTYVKIKSKTGASSRVKPPIVSAKHLSSRSRAKHRDSTTDHRDFIVCFMMIIVILALLLPERTFVFCELVGFVLAEVASILIEAKILRFVLAVVLFTVASLKKQNP